MRTFLLVICIALISIFSAAFANPDEKPSQPLTVVLDWFINPDHAALFVADQQGYFKEAGLQVKLIAPANPADPPKLVAAGKADIAVDYQPHLLLEIAQGLPLQQLGTLIDHPLGCLAVLADSPIHNLSDLKGKRVAYANTGIDTAMLQIMLKKSGLNLQDVQLVAVGYGLSQALLSKKVDAAIGLMRNFELTQLAMTGHPARAFFPEDHGFPPYDELVLVARNDRLHDPRFALFLQALAKGVSYLQAHPEESWLTFAKAHPELNDDLNHKAWTDTLPYFAKHPALFDAPRCQQLAAALNNSLQLHIPESACQITVLSKQPS
jgi:putative hydroxymethylpyrimidine transport system substrate-binding protein